MQIVRNAANVAGKAIEAGQHVGNVAGGIIETHGHITNGPSAATRGARFAHGAKIVTTVLVTAAAIGEAALWAAKTAGPIIRKVRP